MEHSAGANNRGRKSQQGKRTRQAILAKALDVASVHGLEGLSIGGLANAMDMSKSGLFAHFGSKQGLQLATIEAARSVFIKEVFYPATSAPIGLLRLWHLCEAWLSYMEREVFRGGCFFVSVSVEFDGRPGPVRDKIAQYMGDWLEALQEAAQQGLDQGQISEATEAHQLAFEVHSLALGANWSYQLFQDKRSFPRARKAIMARLKTASPTPHILDELLASH